MLGSRQISFSGFRARWKQECREPAGLQAICRNEWKSQNIHAQRELAYTCPALDMIPSARHLWFYIQGKRPVSHSNLPPVKYAQNLTRVSYKTVSRYLAVRAQRWWDIDPILRRYALAQWSALCRPKIRNWQLHRRVNLSSTMGSDSKVSHRWD